MRRFLIIIVLLISILLFPIGVYADQTISIGVSGIAQYNFSGHVAPNSVVTLIENSSVIGTVQSDSSGFFSKTIQEDNALIHTISYYYTDSSNNISPTFSQNVLTTINNLENVSNLILPPTIRVAVVNVSANENVSFSGYTFPSAPVTVTIHSNPIIEQTTSDINGYWSVSVLGSQIGSGSHTVYAVATYDNTTSSSSVSLAFSINQDFSSSALSTIGGAGTSIPSSVTPLPTLKPVPQFLPGDFNFDGKVNSIDLGLFLAHFNEKVMPKTEIFDLNHDGMINLIDFSIMLYFWGR